jgi:hypothetical protein
LQLRHVSQFLDSPPPATSLPVIVFHNIFPQSTRLDSPEALARFPTL